MNELELYDRFADPEWQGEMDGADDWGEFKDPRYGRVSTTTRPSIHYVNESGLPDDVVLRHLRNQGFEKAAISMVEKWTQELQTPQSNQTLDMFNRGAGLVGESHTHAEMARVAWAFRNDDVLMTLADVVEGLMWQKCRFELVDGDQQDLWNQWARDFNLDAQLRKMGREELKFSQFYVGLWWEDKVYTVRKDAIRDQLDEFRRQEKQHAFERQVEARNNLIALNSNAPGFVTPPEIPQPNTDGPGRGNRTRRKKYPVRMPTSATIFDPTKVVPVGSMMFGRERFAYVATRSEDEAFTSALSGEVVDETVMQLIEQKYTPTGADRQACQELGVDPTRLWLFKRNAVFRHTMTKADYERHAPVRMKAVLPILEMKAHLRASDRATLIGNTNFIVVITKGSDKLPAKPAEIANLQEQARVIARLPVLVGDHRLHVEIVSPTLDNTLQDSRWQVLDSRLVFATLKTFSPVTQGGGSSAGTGVSEMSRVVAAGLQGRRHMLMRSIESAVFAKIMDANEGVIDEFPHLEFAPKRITLDFKQDIMNNILKLRDRGDISRETTLEELDYDQDVEVLRRGRERVDYDETFQSSGAPHGSPAMNPFGQQQQPNVGPAGQPPEGGRPPGVTDTQPRKPAGTTGS